MRAVLADGDASAGALVRSCRVGIWVIRGHGHVVQALSELEQSQRGVKHGRTAEHFFLLQRS